MPQGAMYGLDFENTALSVIHSVMIDVRLQLVLLGVDVTNALSVILD